MGDESDAKPGQDDAKPGKDEAKTEAKSPEVPAWLPLPKDFRDFLECTRESLALADSKLDTGIKGVTAGFGAAKKGKGKGHFTITITGLKDKVPVELPDPLELDASIDKDGKMHIHVRDRTDLPQQVKDGIRDFVHSFNRFVTAKGKKVAPPEFKDGKLVLAKVVTTSALPGGKASDGFVAYLPTWEKVGAACVLSLLIVSGVAFMNVGDTTETRTVAVCPEPGGPGKSVFGLPCPGGQTVPVGESPRAGVAEQAQDVYIEHDGGSATKGTLKAGAGGTAALEVPLEKIGEHDIVVLRGPNGVVVDSWSLTVPGDSGSLPTTSTVNGGTAACKVDHANPVLGGKSGGYCTYAGPVVKSTQRPAPAADDSTVKPVIHTTTTTDGFPASIPIAFGLAAATVGALAVDNGRRKRVEYDGGPFLDALQHPNLRYSTSQQVLVEHGVETDVSQPELAPAEDLSPKPYRPPPQIM